MNASRDGLLETEIIELLQSSKIVEGKARKSQVVRISNQMLLIPGSITKLWTNFCWVMGPLLIHNKNIKLMDSVLRSVAEKRYEADMEKAHKILYELFAKQPDIYFDKKRKEQR